MCANTYIHLFLLKCFVYTLLLSQICLRFSELVRSRPTISSDAMSLKNIHYSDVTPKFSNTVNPHKHIGIPSLSNVLSNSLTNEHAPNLEGNIFIQSSSPCSGYVPLSPTSPLFNSASSIVPPTTTHTDTLAEFSSTFPNPIISDMHDDLFSQQVQLPTFSLRRPIATVKKPFIAGADASNVALVAPPNTSIAPSYKRVITVDDFESEEKPIQTVRASRLFLSAAPSCQMPSSIYLSDACLDQSANDKLQVGSDSGSKSIASIARSISTERVNHPTVSDSINAACVRDRGAAEELRLARQHYTCNLLVNTGLSSRSIGHAKQSTKQFSAAQQLVNSVSANSSTVRELAISSVSARQTCFAPLSVMHGPNHVRFNPILPSAMMTSQSQSRGNCRNPRPLQFERPTAPFQHSSDFPREFDSSGPPNILSSSDSLRDIRNGSKTDTDPYAYLGWRAFFILF